ncbi:MAG: hypothetical protein IPG09_13795 [Ignavibacteria bacterium]|nr:hypothetical protein [Ignavibacteria bacterium]
MRTLRINTIKFFSQPKIWFESTKSSGFRIQEFTGGKRSVKPGETLFIDISEKGNIKRSSYSNNNK